MSITLRPAQSSPAGDDERSLLMRLERLLEREEPLIVAQDAAGLMALAEEREHVTARLVALARQRRGAAREPGHDPEEDLALAALYERLRQRHDLQARIVQRHAERNARAIGVLAQATGRGNDLYNANGRVAMQYTAL